MSTTYSRSVSLFLWNIGGIVRTRRLWVASTTTKCNKEDLRVPCIFRPSATLLGVFLFWSLGMLVSRGFDLISWRGTSQKYVQVYVGRSKRLGWFIGLPPQVL